MDQHVNAMEVIGAVRGVLDGAQQKPFMVALETAILSNNPSLDHFHDFGSDLATVQAALPWRETPNGTIWELSVPGIFRQMACFTEESNELEEPLEGNLAGTSHKDLILADIAAWIAAN